MSIFTFGRNNGIPANRVYSTNGVLGRSRTQGASAPRQLVTGNEDFAQSCDVGMGGNNLFNQQMYNPVRDRLDRGSIIEDWIPHSLPALNRMYRNIYFRDGIAGPAVDIWSMLPWSEWDIIGVEDPYIKNFYNEALQTIFAAERMEEMSKEYLVLGRFCASLLYDDAKGYWTDIIPHDPDYLEITPVPLGGIDPLIDLRPSPGMVRFLNNPDPRAAFLLNQVPQSVFEQIRIRGSIPLEPYNTLWAARTISPYDKVGTSFYTRILPYWAIEKPLLNATVTSARRRAGAILHIKIDNATDMGGDPSPEELQEVAGLFMQADFDPVGSIVATRAGINVDEVSGGGQIWKLSDEWTFLSEGKMRALGINDAFLSGDASYNSYDEARSIFMEQIRAFRHVFTQKTIIKYATILARVHGFVKRSTAEIKHHIRVTTPAEPTYRLPPGNTTLQNVSIQQALKYNNDDLIIPTVQWSKSLLPEGDHRMLEILETLKENGVPIPLRTWATLGGISLDSIIKSLPEDVKVQKVITKYQDKLSDISKSEDNEEGEDNEDGFSFGSIESSRTPGEELYDSVYKELQDIGFVKKEIKGSSKKSISDLKRTPFRITSVTPGDKHKPVADFIATNINTLKDFVASDSVYTADYKTIIDAAKNQIKQQEKEIPSDSKNLIGGQ